jgi:hypothetical protein
MLASHNGIVKCRDKVALSYVLLFAIFVCKKRACLHGGLAYARTLGTYNLQFQFHIV